mgnify:CR=1 FL=1
MGGGGFLGLGPAPSAPAAPNYTQAAQATAAGNMIGQVTPYGNLSYAQSGTDASGNPMYTATQTLSPTEQKLLQGQQNTALQLQGYAPGVASQIGQNVSQPFNPTLPSYGINPGQSYQQAEMQILQPQLQHQQDMLNNKLANQGIQPGSEAYTNAQNQLANNQNNLLAQATTQGLNAGLTANQQAYNQALTNYNLPLNTLSALRTGSQVQNPSFVNSAQQATTSGADILGATQMGYNAQMGGFNAANAAQSNLNSGLMGLGGTLGAAAILSDIRTKENIKNIGWLSNGLPVYEYEYKPEWKEVGGHGKFVGVMAQEVEKVIPEAVITRPDGYKMVNYGVLNGYKH